MRYIIILNMIIISIIYANQDYKTLFEQYTGKKYNQNVQSIISNKTNDNLKRSLDTVSEIKDNISENIKRSPNTLSKTKKDITAKKLNNFEQYVRGNIIDPYAQNSLVNSYEFDFSKIKTQKLNQGNKIPDSYLISAGDELVVEIWGAITASYKIQMLSEGYFIIPSIGKLEYFGCNYKELKKRLDNKLKMISGIKYAFYLSSINPIKVFVTGQVNNPGFFNISPFANILEILAVAGGLTSEGSLRTIIIKEEDKTDSLDIYNFLFKGENKAFTFKQNDIVYVPFKTKKVAIVGNVEKQAIYELKAGEKLKNILEFAQMTPYSDKKHIEIERLNKNGQKIQISTSISENMNLEDGDIVRVFSSLVYDAKYIFLKGNFRQNGRREFTENLKLGDLIKEKSLLKNNTYLNYATIIRKTGLGKKNKRINFSLESVLNKDKDSEILLMNQDTIETFLLNKIIPSGEISIVGEVNSGGIYKLIQGIKFINIIEMANGFTNHAFLDSIEVFNSFTKKIKYINFNNEKDRNIKIKANDRISVRRNKRLELHKIELSGEVQFPGIYYLTPNETFYDLLKRCQGYTSEANPKAIRLSRVSVKKKKIESLLKLQSNLKNKLNSLALSEKNPDFLSILQTTKIDTTNIKGRVVIGSNNNKLPVDFKLFNQDKIIIPALSKMVHVAGEVLNPTTFNIEKNKNYFDYISYSGGLTDFSKEDDVIIIKSNGIVIKGISSWFCDNTLIDYKIESDDIIYIPYNYSKHENLTLSKDVTQILYQLGLASAAVYSISK